jgi:hypothetical protein
MALSRDEFGETAVLELRLTSGFVGAAEKGMTWERD